MTKKKKKNDDDDWVKAAMDDDGIVVDLLVRIKRAASASASDQYSAPPMNWCVRQRRSQINLPPLPLPLPARSSPTTALSLSCGGATASTSVSGGDGFEESSCLIVRKQMDASRSNKLKVRGGTFVVKKPKKKTLAVLREEESLLLKERIHLDQKLATLRLDFEEKQATNEILKRQLIEARVNFAHANDPTQNNVASNEPVSSMMVREDNILSLPDLNIPLGDDLTC